MIYAFIVDNASLYGIVRASQHSSGDNFLSGASICPIHGAARGSVVLPAIFLLLKRDARWEWDVVKNAYYLDEHMKNMTSSQNERHAIPGISEPGEPCGGARRGSYGCQEISECPQNDLNDNLRNTNILFTNVKSCLIAFFPWVCFLGPVLLFEYVEKYVLIAFISLSLVLYFLSVKLFRVAYDMTNGPLRKICIYYFYILIFVPGISILWYVINIGTLTKAVENVACARFDPDLGKHVIKPFGIALLYLIGSYACGYYYSHSVFLSFLFVYYIIRGLFYKEFPLMFYFAFYILSSVVIVSKLLSYIQFVPEFLPSLLTMCGIMYGLFLRECYDSLSKAKMSMEGICHGI